MCKSSLVYRSFINIKICVFCLLTYFKAIRLSFLRVKQDKEQPACISKVRHTPTLSNRSLHLYTTQYRCKVTNRYASYSHWRLSPFIEAVTSIGKLKGDHSMHLLFNLYHCPSSIILTCRQIIQYVLCVCLCCCYV